MPTANQPTYQDYEGKLSEDQFNAVLSDACALVNEFIFPRTPKTDKEIAAYQSACCAVIEKLNDDPVVSSWKSGNESVTLADQAHLTLDSTMKRHLIGTNLLCKWL